MDSRIYYASLPPLSNTFLSSIRRGEPCFYRSFTTLWQLTPNLGENVSISLRKSERPWNRSDVALHGADLFVLEWTNPPHGSPSPSPKAASTAAWPDWGLTVRRTLRHWSLNQ